MSPSRLFSFVGVDNFDPLFIGEGKLRNRKIIKAYGTIFICFSTNAIQIDLATDLSTDFSSYDEAVYSALWQPLNNLLGQRNQFYWRSKRNITAIASLTKGIKLLGNYFCRVFAEYRLEIYSAKVPTLWWPLESRGKIDKIPPSQSNWKGINYLRGNV